MSSKNRAKFIMSVASGAPEAPVESGPSASEPVDDATGPVICPRCGTENRLTSNFCKKCGMRLRDGAQSSAPTSGQEPSDQDEGQRGSANDPAEVPGDAAADASLTFPPADQSGEEAEDVPASVDGTAGGEEAFQRVDASPSGPAETETVPGEASVLTEPASEEDEHELVFARGLPEWDLEPPHVVVRRRGGRR